MYYIGNVVKSVAGLYNNLNSATLTGAIDIVVVKQEDGSYVGSPFHVRFGKLGVVSSREKVVEIAINDREIDLQMKLGPAGEAFFVEHTDEQENIPACLSTSPIPRLLSFQYDDVESPIGSPQQSTESGRSQGSPNSNIGSFGNSNLSPGSLRTSHSDLPSTNDDLNMESTLNDIGNKDTGNLDTENTDIPDVQLTPSKSRNIPIPGKWRNMIDDEDDLDLHLDHLDTPQIPYPLSDMDSPISSPISSSPLSEAYMNSRYSVHSDTEVETSHHNQQQHTNTEFKWEWGMLPEGTRTPAKTYTRQTSRTRRKSRSKAPKEINIKIQPETEGLLLDEVLAADKEVADMYLNRTNSADDFDPGYENDSPPDKDDSPPDKDDSPTFPPVKPHLLGDPNDANFSPSSFPLGELSSDPTLSTFSPPTTDGEVNINSPPTTDTEVNVYDDWEPRDVGFSLCGGLKDRKIPPDGFLEALVSYKEFCANPGMLHDAQLVIRINDRYYNWSVAAPYLMAYVVYQQGLKQECIKNLIRQNMPKKRRGWFQWRAPPEDPESSDDEKRHGGRRKSNIDDHRLSIENLSELDEFDSDSAAAAAMDININKNLTGTFEFKKSLRLTSDQWESLNLNDGTNKVTFTVTTKYQGTARADARIFLWDYRDKLVISDIDGTITKSDVLGQILPVVGKDWSQTGVTGLFNQIRHNGYRFIYLSARAIGQAKVTRNFLHGIKQGEQTLPDGPVLLTPTSLFKAFKKEVIERKPEEFKISCLRDIRSLYSKDLNPFYSGFGNRINDVWAYRAVGIPISRVFTINYKGEIKHELTNTFSTSYSKLIELVDQMFPPISCSKTVDTSESDFTAFSFWRTPIIELTLPEDDELV